LDGSKQPRGQPREGAADRRVPSNTIVPVPNAGWGHPLPQTDPFRHPLRARWRAGGAMVETGDIFLVRSVAAGDRKTAPSCKRDFGGDRRRKFVVNWPGDDGPRQGGRAGGGKPAGQIKNKFWAGGSRGFLLNGTEWGKTPRNFRLEGGKKKEDKRKAGGGHRKR